MRLDKVTARVFCTLNGGKQSGNPVTIFASSAAIPQQTQVRLAQQCTWESVMVDTSRQVLQFYMPTGEQVNFCAHAAMGGVTQLSHTMEQPLTFYSALQILTGNQQPQQRQSTATVHDGHVVSLELRETWQASKITQPASLHRLLREACGISASSLVASSQNAWPTFVNYSTARPKTLVYLNSPTVLHQARAPTNPAVFQRACDALETTGLYFYTPKTDHHDDNDNDETSLSFECRQFPRASAYPEDPATGIAASALAVALQKETFLQRPPVAYKFYQGTAMGRPSLIHVDNLEFHSSDDNDDEEQVSFRLLGQVQIDDREEIEEECDGAVE